MNPIGFYFLTIYGGAFSFFGRLECVPRIFFVPPRLVVAFFYHAVQKNERIPLVRHCGQKVAESSEASPSAKINATMHSGNEDDLQHCIHVLRPAANWDREVQQYPQTVARRPTASRERSSMLNHICLATVRAALFMHAWNTGSPSSGWGTDF